MPLSTLLSLPFLVVTINAQTQVPTDPIPTAVAFNPPVQNRWSAFGDSFSAGVGAGLNYGNSGSCRRRWGGFPVQLNASPFLSSNPNHGFDFLACSGGVIADVRNDQVPVFGTLETNKQDLATITIGGNDVGFSDLLEACIFQVRKNEPDCQPQVQDSQNRIAAARDDLVETYKAILASRDAAEDEAGFRLIVVGYPTFFNAATPACDNYSFGFWWFSNNKPLLTTAKRRLVNDLVEQMNRKILEAVNFLNDEYGYQRVRFVDPNTKFNKHRFCELGVIEPDNRTPNSWFFLIAGDDNVQDPDSLPPPTPEQCEVILNKPIPTLGDALGTYYLCAIRAGLSEGKTLAPWLNSTDNQFIPLPQMYAKVFHPKTQGHAAIAEAITDNIRANPPIPANKILLVLLMHDGTKAQFDAFVNGLVKQSAGTAYEQPGINLRGYSVRLELDYARSLKQSPGVVGISFGSSGDVIITSDSAPTEDKKRSEGSSTSKGRIVSAVTKRQTSDTGLRLQTAIFMSTESLHLRVISIPPRSADVAYYRYPGYLYDPRGGENTNVYVLDIGVYVRHVEFLNTGVITNSYSARGFGPFMEDSRGHGTCMASLIGGKITGVAKAVNLIPVRWEKGKAGSSKRADRLFESLLWILHDVIATGKNGQAVINYSAGVLLGEWADPEESDLPIGSQERTDPWFHFLPLFESQGIIVVTSAGNEGLSEADPDAIGIYTPRRYAAPGQIAEGSLIIVGATNFEDKPWSGSNKFPSIITTYAPGVEVRCANYDSGDGQRWRDDTGTSISTAIVSGLIATFLARTDLQGQLGGPGSIAANMKRLVKEIADYSSDSAVNGGGAVDVLRTYNYVRCDEPEDLIGNEKIRRQDTGYATRWIREGGALATTSAGAVCVGTVPIDDFDYIGCVVDRGIEEGGSGVLLDKSSLQTSLGACKSFCKEGKRPTGDFPYWGMQMGRCSCGLITHEVIKRPQRECNYVCRDPTGTEVETCGAELRLSLYGLAGASSNIEQVDGWTYVGCYSDAQERTLTGPRQPDSAAMTAGKCGALCRTAGYARFGVENGNECYCGNTVEAAKRVAEGDCNVNCGGNNQYLCGGGWRLTIYETTPLLIQQVDGFRHHGCFTDDWARTLTGATTQSTQMTPKACFQFCGSAKYFGVEAGTECYCGETIDEAKIAEPLTCDAQCTGDNKFACGGGWRLNVYLKVVPEDGIAVIPGWIYSDCRVDSATRALNGPPIPASDAMTPNRCAAACCGFKYFGVENGNECFCGNSISSAVVPNTECTTQCTGNADLWCGGSWRLFVYEARTGIAASACTPSVSTVSTSASSSVSSSRSISTTLSTSTSMLRTTSSTTSSSPTPVVCPSPQSCESNGCAGSFDTTTGKATCKSTNAGCECQGTAITCGSPKTCDGTTCNGAFSTITGLATCQNFYKGCACLPSPSTCGTPKSCDGATCDGAFDTSTGMATCQNFYKGCACLPSAQTCGIPKSCDGATCSGAFDTSTGKASCTNFYKGCACIPSAQTCGTPKSCDGATCSGAFDTSIGKASCTNFYKGCECIPSPQTCGTPKSCDGATCSGAFDTNTGKASCTNFYKGCACIPSAQTCGTPKSCDGATCAGAFDTSNGKAFCQNFYKGCACIPSPQTCGTPKSCDGGTCSGAFDTGTGQATCQNFYKTCACNPTARTCGTPKSCDGASCNGGFDLGTNLARCRSFYRGCACNPTQNTCGARQSCESNGCKGSIDNQVSRSSTCKGAYLGCACNPTSSTPQHCASLARCDFAGCEGRKFDNNNAIGICTAGPHRSCGCVPVAGTPTPSNNPPPDQWPPITCTRVCRENEPQNCLCFCSDGTPRNNQVSIC